jgi:predicted amidohydrolase
MALSCRLDSPVFVDKRYSHSDDLDMGNTVRIAAAQTPEFRGHIDEAVSHATQVFVQAARENVRLLCFPEGFLQGYFLDENLARAIALDLSSPEFAAVLQRFPQSEMVIVMGMIEVEAGQLYNTAIIVQNQIVVAHYRKAHLLKKESFFKAGTDTVTVSVDGLRFGVNICFDTNFPEAARKIAQAGASLIVCPTNNMLPQPKAVEFRDVHNAVRGERCRESGLWLISADITGQRGDHVGLGPTAVLNPGGDVVAQLPLNEPGILIYDMPVTETVVHPDA